MMFVPFFQHHGVLGLNARNLLYVRPFNPRKAVAFADDKLKTKAYLSARGIPSAKLYARIESRRQLRSFDFSTLPDHCVLKPNYGFGGEGIIVLKGRKNGKFLRLGKEPISDDELREHIEDILDGKFAVNGRNDTAFFEQILVSDDCFRALRPAGLPDIRVIVFNLVPVMAMLRIPTAESGGKANIHLGGIGIGIDLGKGVTTYGAQYHNMITALPHGQPVQGHVIPRWDEILLICSRIQYMTNIGYLAVDITIDQALGPVLLEVNARAGLMVQVANLAPLRSRLERVKGLHVSSPEKGVLLGKELFGTEAKARQHADRKQPIIGLTDIATLAGGGITIREACRIDPTRDDSTIARSLVTELIAQGIVSDQEISRGCVRVKCALGEQKIQTMLHIDEAESTAVRLCFGKRDLKGFLIDPSRVAPHASTLPRIRTDLRAMDRLICGIDRELSFLSQLRPINLAEERKRAIADARYCPIFQYAPLAPAISEYVQSLKLTQSDGSVMGKLLFEKSQETLMKIDALQKRGTSNYAKVIEALYGRVEESLVTQAKAHLAQEVTDPKQQPQAKKMSTAEAEERFLLVLKNYGLHEWSVKRRVQMITDCAVGRKTIFLREGATFSPLHLEALIAHEIEVHVLTSENAAVQPYEIFRRGFRGYTDTQEGLAIWSQERLLPRGHEKRKRHAENVLAASVASSQSFADLRRFLVETLGYDDAAAVAKAINLKRGLIHTEAPGCFTRTLAYFRGYTAVCAYIGAGKSLEDLYLGKVSIESLPEILQIEGREPPLLLPVWMRSHQ